MHTSRHLTISRCKTAHEGFPLLVCRLRHCLLFHWRFPLSRSPLLVRFDMLLVVLLGFWCFSCTYRFVIINACCVLGCLQLRCVLSLLDCVIVVCFASICSLLFSQCLQVVSCVFLAYARSIKTVVKFTLLLYVACYVHFLLFLTASCCNALIKALCCSLGGC